MDELIKANKQGIVCGPKESLENFRKRKKILEDFSSHFPAIVKEDKNLIGIENKTLVYEDLDLSVNWFLVKKERTGLFFWEAAATWDIEIEGSSASFVQYKKTKQVSTEELFKHELVHCVRQAFHDHIYEEFLAYATSPSFFRRFFGPLFHTPRESLMFVIVSLGCSIGFLFELTVNFCFYVWIGLIVFFLIRLFINHLIFYRALLKIKNLFKEENPLKIAIRMTDNEIRFFCFSSLEKIKTYVRNKTCIRWNQIISSYKLK